MTIRDFDAGDSLRPAQGLIRRSASSWRKARQRGRIEVDDPSVPGNVMMENFDLPLSDAHCNHLPVGGQPCGHP